jgi:flagellar hook-associated protein 2
MAGSISSLGIGSGVLTADVIDQLKAADATRLIDPVDAKITFNTQQQEAEKLLSTLMNTLKASASSLSYDTLFDTKTVDITGEAQVTVDAGANVESFTLETTTLAKKEVIQSGSFADKVSTTVGSSDAADYDGSETFDITIDGTTYNIPYNETTTLSDLAQAITDGVNGAVKASILQTGTDAYSLVLTSGTTGADQSITLNDGGGLLKDQLLAYDATNNPSGYQTIQAATDANFKYNGIDVTRSTNEITDLILGVNITLKKEGDISNVDIKQDTASVVDEMQLFVDNYNNLIANLNDMTAFNKDAGSKGVFNGNSFVRSIRQEITQTIMQRVGRESLVDYGIDLARDGTMTLDKTTLESKLASDPDGTKLFFTGGIDSNGNTQTGLFTDINDKLNSYTGYGKLLNNLETNLKTDATNLTDNKNRAQASLDARYEIMTKRFTAYDGIISKLNSQFSSLQKMIDAQKNSNK